MDLVQKAKEDKERLQASVQKKEAELAAVREKIQKVNIFIEMAEQYGAGNNLTSPKPRKPPGSQAKTELVVGIAKSTLKEKGVPLATTDLLSVVEQHDIETKSTDKRGWLSGILSRSGEFDNIRGSGWHLKEWGVKTKTKDDQDKPDEKEHPFQTNGFAQSNDKSNHDEEQYYPGA